MYGFQSFYALFFIFLVFYLSILKANVKDRKKFSIGCFILFFLMAGLRGDTVGGDLKRYLPEFYSVAMSDFKYIWEVGHHEPGYLLYIKLLSLISSDSRMFLLGTSFLSLVGPIVLFKKYSNNITVSVLLYYAMGYYTNTFNNVRQAIALSIVFCVIPYLINRKFWKYLLGVVIATTFHYSAIIALIVYPLIAKPFNFKRWAIYSGTSLIIGSLFFFSIFRYVVETFVLKYDPESILEESEGNGYRLFLAYLLIFIVMSIYYWKTNKRIKESDKIFLSMLLLFQMFTTAIQLTAPVFHTMVRMTYYFFIPTVTLAIPFICSRLNNTKLKPLFYVCAFSVAILYMCTVVYRKAEGYNSNAQGAIPYVFLNTEIF